MAAAAVAAQQVQPDATTATMTKAADELDDMDGVNRKGKTIGDIDAIVGGKGREGSMQPKPMEQGHDDMMKPDARGQPMAPAGGERRDN